jgi:hypothetical protein
VDRHMSLILEQAIMFPAHTLFATVLLLLLLLLLMMMMMMMMMMMHLNLSVPLFTEEHAYGFKRVLNIWRTSLHP